LQQGTIALHQPQQLEEHGAQTSHFGCALSEERQQHQVFAFRKAWHKFKGSIADFTRNLYFMWLKQE
jgi:hypothetical protein